MVILGLVAIEDMLKKHAGARAPMARWVAIAESATWQNISDMRRTLPSADAIKGTELTCFNIGGNSYRLLTVVSYQRQQIVIRELLTPRGIFKEILR
jgi:mRNA interferase HigB